MTGLLRGCELLEPEYLVQLLKAVKHLSMSPTLLDGLQNANAIEILITLLMQYSSGPHSTVRRLYCLLSSRVLTARAGGVQLRFPNML